MSEGLGLNHFADGLPYTPHNAKRKPVVNFNYPTLGERPSMGKALAKSLAEFDAEAPTEVLELREPLNANFLRRVLAYAVDVLVSTGIFASIVWASFSLNGYNLEQLFAESRGQIFWPLTLLYVVVHMGYFLIQETTWQRTIGKAVMGIRIRSTSGFATLGRAVCFFISALPLGVGLFWYFFDSKRRCWHDVITDSEVVGS